MSKKIDFSDVVEQIKHLQEFQQIVDDTIIHENLINQSFKRNMESIMKNELTLPFRKNEKYMKKLFDLIEDEIEKATSGENDEEEKIDQ